MAGHLKAVPGVESAEVDYASKTATVVVKGPVTDEMLVKAVANDVSCTRRVDGLLDGVIFGRNIQNPCGLEGWLELRINRDGGRRDPCAQHHSRDCDTPAEHE